MNSKSFGLDIGITTIKAVDLSYDKSGFFLNAFSSQPAPSRGMLSESLLDQEDMAQTIKRVTANIKTQSHNVHIALPDNQVYAKVIEMPFLSDKELSSAIYWEAEQYIPVPLSTITLVWTVLKKPANPQASEKMQVFIVGAPISLINKYQKVLGMAGLTAVSMETETLSTIRALAYPNFPQTIIVNIGVVSTSLAIIRGGVLVFTYSIPTGGAAISRSIEADFGVTQDQSEAYKKTYGVSGGGVGEKIGKSTEPILSAIVTEVKKALAFYSQKYKDDDPSIAQILLAGDTAKLPGVHVFFANNLGIETVVSDAWKKIVNRDLQKEALQNAPDYTVAIGLAMRAYE